MAKQKCCYVIADQDGKEIEETLDFSKVNCLDKFYNNSASGDWDFYYFRRHLKYHPLTFKYWYRRGYRVKKLWLSNWPEPVYWECSGVWFWKSKPMAFHESENITKEAKEAL